MSDGVFDLDLVQYSTVVQLDKEGITDRPLGGFVIFDTETLVFNAVDFGTKGVDTWVSGRGVSTRCDVSERSGIDGQEICVLAFRSEFTENQRIRHHVIDGMTAGGLKYNHRLRYRHLLSVSKVVEWALLVNNPDGSFLSSDSYALDVFCSLSEGFQFCMDDVSRFNGGLSMEFGGIGDFEEDVFHDVGRVRNLELKGLALHDRELGLSYNR